MKTLNQCLAVGAVLSLTALAAPAMAQDPQPIAQPQQTEPRTAPRPQDPTPQPESPWTRPQDMQTPRSAEMKTATGTLVSVDNDMMQLTIKAADETEHSFRYTAATKVVGADAQVSGLATRAGQIVTVHYTDGAANSKVATKVEFGKSKK